MAPYQIIKKKPYLTKVLRVEKNNIILSDFSFLFLSSPFLLVTSSLWESGIAHKQPGAPARRGLKRPWRSDWPSARCGRAWRIWARKLPGGRRLLQSRQRSRTLKEDLTHSGSFECTQAWSGESQRKQAGWPAPTRTNLEL